VFPLALFAWAARRLPLSTIGFLQFIVPTLGFATGLETGEKLTPLTGLSFGFIWVSAMVFVFGAWRAGRRLRLARVQSPA
jgi:chloramphenicol-sensitive protein RarD